MLLSKAAFDDAADLLAAEPAFAALAAVRERRTNVRQAESDFDLLYAQAAAAHAR